MATMEGKATLQMEEGYKKAEMHRGPMKSHEP